MVISRKGDISVKGRKKIAKIKYQRAGSVNKGSLQVLKHQTKVQGCHRNVILKNSQISQQKGERVPRQLRKAVDEEVQN